MRFDDQNRDGLNAVRMLNLLYFLLIAAIVVTLATLLVDELYGSAAPQTAVPFSVPAPQE